MSKKLFLVRHGEAQQSERGLQDFDRSLTDEGIKNASLIGRDFFRNAVVLHRMMVSPALRARETATIIADMMKFSHNRIRFPEILYNASVRELLATVNNQENDISSVMLIAHNPSLTYMAEYLCKQDIGNIPPAGLVEIEFSLEQWGMISEGTGLLIRTSF
jgi:phosphohistidine phosphatase